MKRELKKGEAIPEVTLKNQDGELVNLKDYVGKHALVVYFYPKDDTPGCTAEACGFRDSHEEFEATGAQVVGISADSVGAHRRFADKHRLNFTLLSDANHAAEKAFGVPRNMLGLLPGRVTYVFNKEGKLISKFNSAMQATRHVKEALQMLDTNANH